MIIGIGTDLIDIRRIEKTLARFGEKFIQRCFTPQEIAKAVAFLAADGDYITGQQINVNGGVYM